MITHIQGYTATDIYETAMGRIATDATTQDSRNGKVYSIPHPVIMQMHRPDHRVLFTPIRKPNHTFHVMEAIWMLAGERNVEWLLQFNSQMGKYAEDNGDIHGAYGYRWRRYWNFDQIKLAISRLQHNHNDRQVVVTMWDPAADMDVSNLKDRPCNTQIMFRIIRGKLDMSVVNRSNDLIFGMMGSNVVHMTMLHELVASAVGVGMGTYTVFTQNLHVYPDIPYYSEIRAEAYNCVDQYSREVSPRPMINQHESAHQFLTDCSSFVAGEPDDCECAWFHDVAAPMMYGYLNKERRDHHWNQIKATDWKLALEIWQ